MRKALIPTVFVLAGVVATNLWSRVKLPCETLQIDMARAVMSQLLTCAVDELLTANRCSGVVSSASRLVVKVATPRNDFAAFPNGSRIHGAPMVLSLLAVNSQRLSAVVWSSAPLVLREF